MEFTSFSTESCAPAGDGGIVPGLVPIPNVDPDALEEAAGRLRAVGEAIEESGEGITSTWASLTGIYVAPEADTLLSVLDPVSSDGSTVATGVRDAASALETFAETARELKSRLTGLKSEAEAFRADVGWDREWLEDEDERERNNDLNNRVAAAVHEYQEAERACANAIGQHYGGTFFTGHSDKANHDQTSTGGDRAWQVYGTASAPVDQANPWGSAVDEPPGALENVFWSVGDIAIGMAVGLGGTTGLYRDGQFAYPFGTEHGQNLLTNWEEAEDGFWALAGSDGQGEWIAPESLDAQYHNAKEAWQAYGDSIVPVSEWDHRPEYTIVNGAANIALMASPLGWGRVFLDGPDLGTGSGSGSGSDGNGSPDGGRGTHGVDGSGNGLRGTDTVDMATTAPTGDQPDPGGAVGGMHESLAGLESQIGGSPVSEGAPNGSPPPAVPPAPEAPTAPMGDAPSSNGDGAAPRSEGASVGSETDAPREANDPTARELYEGTSDSGTDTFRDPWVTSPVNDGSTSGQESPATPVSGPASGEGSTVDGSGTADSANSGSDHSGDGQNGQGSQGNGAANDHGHNGTGEDRVPPTPDGGSGSGDEPPRDGAGTGGDDGEGGQEDEQGSGGHTDGPEEGEDSRSATGEAEIDPSELLPGGGLAANEAAGGHAIERHVGVSIEYLKDRTLGNIPGAPSGRVAGSYHDLETAELATAIALDKNSTDISSWLQQDMSVQTNRRKLLKNVEVNLEDIGYAVKRLGSAANPTGWEYPNPTHVTIMLVYEPDMPPHHFRIHTSYPVPKPNTEIQIPTPTINP
jgi:hypothetical protein